MEIYVNSKILNFENIHLSVFENRFFEEAEKLKNMIEPDFSSIIEIKGKNKELLDLAFDAEFHQNY